MSDVAVMLYGRKTEELEAFVKSNLKCNSQLIVKGVLDGFSDQEVASLEANNPATGVPEYLADGSVVFVDHNAITKGAINLANIMAEQGISQSLICCTAPWPGLEQEKNIIIPSKILEHVALSLLPQGGTLAVVQPVEETKDEELKHWQALGVNLIRATFSPEEGSDDELLAVTRQLADQGADVIVLDCLSFVERHKKLLRTVTSKPVLLPMSLIGRLIDEVMGD